MNANNPEVTAPAVSTVGDDVLLILPVRNLVLFPGVVMPLTVGRKGSVEAAQEAARSDRPLGLLLQKDASIDDPGPDDLYRVGTVASVLRFVSAQDGAHHLVCQGEERFRVLDFIPGHPYLLARVERLPAAPEDRRRRRGARAEPAPAGAGRRSNCCRRRRPSWCTPSSRRRPARRWPT